MKRVRETSWIQCTLTLWRSKEHTTRQSGTSRRYCCRGHHILMYINGVFKTGVWQEWSLACQGEGQGRIAGCWKREKDCIGVFVCVCVLRWCRSIWVDLYKLKSYQIQVPAIEYYVIFSFPRWDKWSGCDNNCTINCREGFASRWAQNVYSLNARVRQRHY